MKLRYIGSRYKSGFVSRVTDRCLEGLEGLHPKSAIAFLSGYTTTAFGFSGIVAVHVKTEDGQSFTIRRK